MDAQAGQEDSEITNPVKRIRWATHRAKGPRADKKRQSLMDRLHHKRTPSDEKKRNSAGKESTIPDTGDESSTAESEEVENGRRVYFNIPLPPQERDEEGSPKVHYARNKIRTAKYTPISFIPKNLWFQFHTVANIYFLFIIILGVCYSPCTCMSSD